MFKAPNTATMEKRSVNFENSKRPVVDDRPIDWLLAGYAARTLDPPLLAVIEAHLDMKPDNRSYVAALEEAHGIFLAQLDPVPLTGRDRRLVNIFSLHAGDDAPSAAGANARTDADQPLVPASLRRYVGCDFSELTWCTVTAGVEQAVVATGDFGEASFMRCRPGTRFRLHGHTGIEAILVLAGCFSDEQGCYGRGDIAVADETRTHQPIVGDEDLVCFMVAHGHGVKTRGPFGRLIGQILGQ